MEDGRRPGEVVRATDGAPVGVEQTPVVAGPCLQQQVTVALGDVDGVAVVANRFVVSSAVVQYHPALHPGTPGVRTGQLGQRVGYGPQRRRGTAGVGQYVTETHLRQRPGPGGAGGAYRRRR